MCKILAMAGIKLENLENAWKFIHEASDKMTFHPERDGVGYAAMTAAGSLFGERWVDPKDAFKNRYEPSEAENAALRDFGKAFVRSVEYSRFGEFAPELMTSIILHSRYATSPKGLVNTHPFVKDGVALIHNGVVTNERELKYEMSSCDSEGILHAYLDDEVSRDPQNIEYVAQAVQGSYACAVLGTDADSAYLDIFKNEVTSLVACRIKELDTIVFCTNMEIINRTCAALHFTVEFSFWVRGGYLLRLNQNTGAVKGVYEFCTQYVPPKIVNLPAKLSDVNAKVVGDREFTAEEIAELEADREAEEMWQRACKNKR